MNLSNGIKYFNSSFNDVDGVGVAIGRPDSRYEQQHIGLLFIDADGQPKFLHLAWHYQLKKDSPDDNYLWLDTSLDSINKVHLATFCASIFESNPNGIPYGVCIDGASFSEEGFFIAEEKYAGMTCATFVINVFHSQGFLIIDSEKWSVRETDRAWQEQILRILENHAPKEYVESQKQRIQQGHVARFRPEEVAIAAALSNAPHGLDILEEPAKELLNSIIKHIKAMAINEKSSK